MEDRLRDGVGGSADQGQREDDEQGPERLSRHTADRRRNQASFVSRGRDRLLRDRQLGLRPYMDGAVGSCSPQNVGFVDTRLKTEKQNISTRF